ncbi:hypothetical protein GCM10022406_41710 [Hymenobacter algoricola]|uniref:Uncharacterized protein n=1 Tax=Hymenobacter algoricola TaxID=486267 RepID=A0ABP7NYS7_9BACT
MKQRDPAFGRGHSTVPHFQPAVGTIQRQRLVRKGRYARVSGLRIRNADEQQAELGGQRQLFRTGRMRAGFGAKVREVPGVVERYKVDEQE